MWIFNLLVIFSILSNVYMQGVERNDGSNESNFLNTIHSNPYKVISSGGNSGDYQAVPDVCRLLNGDILVVFYAGDNHITFPNKKHPKSGRICMIRSKDEGRTWSNPQTIYDDIYDNRDPHISQLSNGVIVCSFFSLKFDKSPPEISNVEDIDRYAKEEVLKYGNNPDLINDQESTDSISKSTSTSRKWIGMGPYIIESYDNGDSWIQEATLVPTSSSGWYCSAKVREMPNGTCILPLYYVNFSQNKGWGGVTHSYDKGKTWSETISIGENAKLMLAAETDIILLNDNTLYAALRGDGTKVNMHYSVSHDLGKSWECVNDIGFIGHAPSFTRLKNDEIILSYRAYDSQMGYYTGMRISRDEAKTWEGPYLIDKVIGAYPSTVELNDSSILIIYYEEGVNSSIRALRFRKPEYSTKKPLSELQEVHYLPLNQE